MSGFRRISFCTAALGLAACAPPEKGVTLTQPGDAVISLSEGACPHDTCPVYDMTLHKDGSYVLNGERYVKTTGVSRGDLGADTWAAAEKALEDAKFWELAPMETPDKLPGCQHDAPTVQVLWRTDKGKEKTLVYNAGCGVVETRTLISRLRTALRFDDLVWTNEKFHYDPAVGH